MPTKKSGLFIVKSNRKTDKQLFVRATGKNGNILHNSETFKRKTSCLINIIASAKIYSDILSGKGLVTDENGVKWIYNGKKFVKA